MNTKPAALAAALALLGASLGVTVLANPIDSHNHLGKGLTMETRKKLPGRMKSGPLYTRTVKGGGKGRRAHSSTMLKTNSRIGKHPTPMAHAKRGTENNMNHQKITY